MITRLVTFYRNSVSGYESTVSGLWLNLVSVFQKPLVDALNSGDPALVESVLNKLIESGSTTGIEGHSIQPGTDRYNEIISLLAKRIGVVPIQNPEQPSPSDNWHLKDPVKTVSDIEESLGFPLASLGCFGQSLEGGMPTRFAFYCSAAFTMKCLGRAPYRVLEIGAGLGNMGLLCQVWKSNSFTVIDLPSVAVLSSYFASKIFGESKIWLLGEVENGDTLARFYPSTNFEGAKKLKYDLVFNSDSLPEMPSQVQDQYLRLIRECLSPDGIFLSINHESDLHGQGSVISAVNRNGGLKLVARYPFMMRDGYVEEIYKPD